MTRAEFRQITPFPIETVRAVAIIILVSFHVIGGADGRGLGLESGHPLRIYADLLVDLRMPLFAFVSGLVYAIRPVSPADIVKFLTGKFRRLMIPGSVAMTLFAIAAIASGAASQPPEPFWTMYFRSYSIFWFLQAIFLIFITAGTIDIISRGKLLLPMLLGSIILLCFGIAADSSIMSADQLTLLLPYFLLGVFVVRERNFVISRKDFALTIAAVFFATGLIINLKIFFLTGEFSTNRLDAQSFLFGSGACVLAILIFPNTKRLSRLGAYSFTIYLYHIFATSGSRKALLSLEIDSPYIHLAVGTILGIFVPAAFHLLASKWGPSRQFFLGLKPISPSVKPGPSAPMLPWIGTKNAPM